MPKIIKDARQTILQTARQQLLREGYKAFNIRETAASSGIAVGTVYNYFQGKEMLIASVMQEDWKTALQDIREGIRDAQSIEQGFFAIYSAIEKFSEIYDGVWKESEESVNIRYDFRAQHKMCRSQISEEIEDLLDRFGKRGEPCEIPVLAEGILACAIQNDIGYDGLERVINKMYR